MLLTDYHDNKICRYLQYGWPVNRATDLPDPQESDINHKGATDYASEISRYLKEEKQKGRMAGPFSEKPFSKITSRIGMSLLRIGQEAHHHRFQLANGSVSK